MNLLKKIRSILKDLGCPNADKIHLDRFHRLPLQKKGAPRPVIVRFTFSSDRQAAWKAKKSLRGTNYYIREDFCQATLDYQNSLRPLVSLARKRGLQCSISGEKLYLEGKFYNKDQLNDLPHGISLLEATKVEDDQTLAFYGKGNPLSNFIVAILWWTVFSFPV